jgi:hypothetical protein
MGTYQRGDFWLQTDGDQILCAQPVVVPGTQAFHLHRLWIAPVTNVMKQRRKYHVFTSTRLNGETRSL